MSEKSISITWYRSDVLSACPHLTADQADRVLESMERHHDANIGINWDVISTTAGKLFGSDA